MEYLQHFLELQLYIRTCILYENSIKMYAREVFLF